MNTNQFNELRRRAGLPLLENTEEMDEMLKVLQALKGAYMSLNQVKSDLEDNMLVNRMGMSNGEYVNSTISDQLAAISECMSRFSKTVKNHTSKDEADDGESDDSDDSDGTMYENASGSASGAGSIASGIADGNNKSAYADKVRKDKKTGKKTETIFALSDS